MLPNFFQIGPIPADQMIGSYDPRLVVLSYLVATFASYIALDITGRLRDLHNTKLSTALWLAGGAFAMGSGIWSMHFIGMLAFSMPNMVMSLDPFWTVLSMFVAIFASSFAFYLLKEKIINISRLVLGGVILGIAIASMHYTGMAAMEIALNIHYLPGLFFLSILIAIIASEAALYLALKSNQVIPRMRFRLKLISAFIMGLAICGMHYTGMASAIFTHKENHIQNTNYLNPEILAISIAAVTFLILGIAILVSTYKEAQNQKLLSMARQAGMAEVAATILHNVGNVLNTVNISASVIAEKINKSSLLDLKLLSDLINEHKKDLHQFITNDPRGIELPNFLNMLADQFHKEQIAISEETKLLINNIEHIKDIISFQQDLSKVSKQEEIVLIPTVLEEALFITGIEVNYPEIQIEKKYKDLKPVILDKVKLLQILVNLLQNAKDALIEFNGDEKHIKIQIDTMPNNKFTITITDNGIGISAKNMSQIFSYGFTTKKSGHGFGLHVSALAAKEMGGLIKPSSAGLKKGAIFTLELPYSLPSR